jgi:broad specificity polyphosphatase/5'/3'-nucleotidase SurE
LAKPADLKYQSTITSFEAPDGDTYHFYRGCLEQGNPPAGTDWEVLQRGRISVSPIGVLPTLVQDEGLFARLEVGSS